MTDFLIVALVPAIGLWLVIRQILAWRGSAKADTFLENPDDWGAL